MEKVEERRGERERVSERQRGRGKSEEIRNGSNAILRNARWVSPMGGLRERERERRNEGRRPERRGRERALGGGEGEGRGERKV